MSYSTGTISLTNGNTTVTGSGTAWVGAIRAGWLILIPGEGPLLVQSVVSATSVTLARAYQGSTRSGQVYNAVPTQGELTPFVDQLQTVISGLQATVDGAGTGRFGDGSAATPGLRFATDEDTGLFRPGSNQVGFSAGGTQRALLSTTALSLTVPLLAPYGTAAAPGLTFAGDPDTGLLRPAANQIGFAAGGTQRALLTGSALQVDVPVTGTAVAANATDATSGTLARFFASGIHGLGTASPPVLSAPPDSLGARQISTGFSAYNSSNLTDAPETSSWVHTMLTLAAGPGVVGGGNTRRNYLAVRSTGGVTTARLWLGAHSNDNPVLWSEIFHQNYLVGTVSQSGGVPTGRVIERGSNANGDYLRLADGTQICSRSLNLGSRLAHGAGTYADPYRTGNNTWTFPAAFATAPTLAGAAEVDSAVGADKIHVIAIQTRTTTSASGIQAIAGSGSAVAHNVTAHLIAIGRWFEPPV